MQHKFNRSFLGLYFLIFWLIMGVINMRVIFIQASLSGYKESGYMK